MNIHFYLDNEEDTQITSFYDLSSNPFKLGDEICLDVEELSPADYSKFNQLVITKMIANNNKLRDKFRLKTIKLIRERKYVKFKIINDSELTIEYHCVCVND